MYMYMYMYMYIYIYIYIYICVIVHVQFSSPHAPLTHVPECTKCPDARRRRDTADSRTVTGCLWEVRCQRCVRWHHCTFSPERWYAEGLISPHTRQQDTSRPQGTQQGVLKSIDWRLLPTPLVALVHYCSRHRTLPLPTSQNAPNAQTRAGGETQQTPELFVGRSESQPTTPAFVTFRSQAPRCAGGAAGRPRAYTYVYIYIYIYINNNNHNTLA